MSEPTEEQPPINAERLYVITAFVALLATLLLLSMREQSIGGLIVSAIGSAGVLFHWRGAPSCLMLTLLWLWLVAPVITGGGHSTELDVPLAFAVLAYLQAQCRLYVLGEAGPALSRRSDARPEMGRGLALLAVALTAGATLWASLPDGPDHLRLVSTWAAITGPAGTAANELLPDYSLRRENQVFWKLACLTWLFVVAWIIVTTVIGVLGLYRMRSAEAAIILQDAAWDESRRELERLARWAERGRTTARQRENA